MLTNSQAATLAYINERPGKRSAIAVGLDMAASLEAAGYITGRKGMCHPTALAASFKGRSVQKQQADRVEAHVALMGRYATL